MWNRLAASCVVAVSICAAFSPITWAQNAGPLVPNPAYASTVLSYTLSPESGSYCTDEIQIQSVSVAGLDVAIRYSVVAHPRSDCFLDPPLELSLPLGPFPSGVYLVRAVGDYRGTPLPTITTNLTILPGPSPIKSYQGLWWNAPAGSESGWGMNLAHQGNVIFVTWFTYNLAGDPWWLTMTALRSNSNTYSGTLFETTGPPFDAVPFPPMGAPLGATARAVGTGTLAFSDENNATFAYTVNGVSQTKIITREVFGVLPDCLFEPNFDPNRATNVTDLWWADPPASESGWGLNITEQAVAAKLVWYVTWFTYDHSRAPTWYSATANFDPNSGTFTGDLYQTKGPPFNAVPFPPIGSPGGAIATKVGIASFINYSGASKSFRYIVNGITQTKTITRQVYGAPRAICTQPFD